MNASPGDRRFTVVVVGAASCGREAVYSMSFDAADSLLRRAVAARLIAEPRLINGHIEVAVIAGRVILSGYVTSNGQKSAACAATRSVEGVRQVTDDVRVAVPCPAVADLPHLSTPELLQLGRHAFRQG